tara:strand:- start:1332 stop:2969 length:1638 start_codon:yes stop_codon:yes gene_type:complete
MTEALGHLSRWIAAPEEVSGCTVDLFLDDGLARAAAAWPHSKAVIYRHQPAVNDVAWTYADLDKRVSALATGLSGLGFRPGERIAVWGPNHPEWILLEYAIARAGLVLVALNPLYSAAELRFALEDSNAAGVFHADRIGDVRPADILDSIRSDLPCLRRYHAFSALQDVMLLPGDPGSKPIMRDPGDMFMIQYTSGTTGDPKAVRLSHRALTTTGLNSYALWGIGEGSRVCFGFPLFHVGGSGNSIPGACLAGATALPLYIFKANIALDILEHERCTAFIGVPTMLLLMLDDPSFAGRDFSALKSIIVGGAPVTRELLLRCRNQFGAEVINCYGQTETSGVTASTRFSDSDEKKIATSGQPLVGVSLEIRNDQGDCVTRQEVGELFYRGPGGMNGYGSGEDSDRTTDGWIASGDLAQMDDDGFVSIVGRKKEMIIRGGENLSPVEIESYMKEHDAIADVAVIGVPDARYGEVACAAVRLRSDAEIESADILDWCRARISRWKVPEFIEFVDDFPMTPSGKIQKFKLQENMIERLGLSANKGDFTK